MALPHGGRKFYDLPCKEDGKDITKEKNRKLTPHEFFEYIADNVIGKDKEFTGPYGRRSVSYCDYTASGRSLKFLEDFIQQNVLPEYGNTHTTTTVTARQTTMFRHEARDIVRNAVNASEHDAIVFTGSGCTAAVHKIIHALNFKQPPVVFCGPWEHHSNMLPWRDIDATVIRIQEDQEGNVDLEHLEQSLKAWTPTGRELVGCFSAASNVTGHLADVDAISVMLHTHGALALWDYATAGPYVEIDMNPVAEGNLASLAYKDAIFISAHKFVGGVQTPGILVAKKKLFRNLVPSLGGGGSVFFVRRDSHRYLKEIEMREEGGTPAIVETIRAGLVFQLKESVTAAAIMDREHQLYRKAVEHWKNVDGLVMLGNTAASRLPVFSFLIQHGPSGLFLHHNLLCALLNDLFGIQARGGCACAGPYAQDLLGIDEKLALEYEQLLLEDERLDRTHLRRYGEYSDKEILRPGFSRLNLPYFLSDEEIDYVLKAVKFVAQHGWKLLPQYLFNPETGEWRHKDFQTYKDRKWLGNISYTENGMVFQESKSAQTGQVAPSFKDCLEEAEKLVRQAEKRPVAVQDQRAMFDGPASKLRWFLLPSEAAVCLKHPGGTQKLRPPFSPPSYPKEKVIPRNIKLPEKPDYSGVGQNTGYHGNSSYVQPVEPCRTCVLPREAPTNDTGLVSGTSTTEAGSQNQPDSCKFMCKPRSANCTRECLNNSCGMKDKGSEVTSVCPCDHQRTAEIKAETSEDKSHTNSTTSSVRTQNVEEERLTLANLQISLKSETENINKGNELSGDAPVTQDLNSKNPLKTDAASESDSGDGESGIFGITLEADAGIVKVGSGKNSPGTTGSDDGKACQLKLKTKLQTSKLTAGQYKWHAPPRSIFKPTMRALEEYDMIKNGDRVLVCLSGGKDSLSLLHMIRQYQFLCKRKGLNFEFGAVTVDPQTSSYDPSPLKKYLAGLDVPYFYEEQCILETAQNLSYEVASICSFCSRMKRGRIYAAARKEGYNVLALGQHLDDLSESFLMSIFHNGLLRTMKAHYKVSGGELRVIRPFVYVREKDLRQFAEEKRLPVIAENCPACFEAPKERHRMKQLLANQEIMFPTLYNSLMAALKPIMAINETGVNMKTLASKNKLKQQEEEEE